MTAELVQGLLMTTLGNQAFNEDWSRIRLCVAIEDFAVQASPTDIFGQVDKSSSGKCLMLRLDSSADYVEEKRLIRFGCGIRWLTKTTQI